MSAFIVGADHIDALLTFASEYGRYGYTSYYEPQEACNVPGGRRVEITTENATEIGRILLAENERSVRHRYQDIPPAELGCGIAQTYRFKLWPMLPRLEPVAILNGCNCFDYQACETDDYEQSTAHRIIEAIRKRAIFSLPGYDAAKAWPFERQPRRRTA